MTLPISSGPWAVGSNGATAKVVDSDGKAVCMLTPRRDQFNGDLIAAAPDLLAALQAILTGNVYGDPDEWNSRVAIGFAAIAKATGVQS